MLAFADCLPLSSYCFRQIPCTRVTGSGQPPLVVKLLMTVACPPWSYYPQWAQQRVGEEREQVQVKMLFVPEVQISVVFLSIHKWFPDSCMPSVDFHTILKWLFWRLLPVVSLCVRYRTCKSLHSTILEVLSLPNTSFLTLFFFKPKTKDTCLGRVAQLVRALSGYTKVAGLIPDQGTYKNQAMSPDWCGSVYWALDCEPKGRGSIPSEGTCLGWGPGPQ